jgi:acyl phosphate:glycerol-3-phosphate acyltransferase
VTAVALAVFAYLLGSLSPSLLLGRLFKGIDLREHGSGNLGATNAFRVLGRGWGILVLAADLLKGFVPVLLARLLTDPWPTVIVALCAIAGHNYSIFLRGRGGKGVATGAGTVLAMMPLVLAVQLATWGVVLLASGYVSLASVVATAIFPLLAAFTGQPLAYLVFSVAGAAVVLWAHRSNLRRLAGGTERRLRFSRLRRPRRGQGAQGEPPGGSEGEEVGDGR